MPGWALSSKTACVTYLLTRKGRGGGLGISSVVEHFPYYAEGMGPVPTDELRINQS